MEWVRRGWSRCFDAGQKDRRNRRWRSWLERRTSLRRARDFGKGVAWAFARWHIGGMPCLIALFALLTPRVVLIVVWIVSDYLGRAYQTALWPVLGFIFMPVTTLAYAYAINSSGSVSGFYFVLTLVAAMIDLGILGGSGRARRRRGR
jgi:hypothetical protein